MANNHTLLACEESLRVIRTRDDAKSSVHPPIALIDGRGTPGRDLGDRLDMRARTYSRISQ